MPRSRQINTQSLYFTERLTWAMGDIMKHPLTVVEAPMGYGKTTAVREAVGRAGIMPHWIMFSPMTPMASGTALQS